MTEDCGLGRGRVWTSGDEWSAALRDTKAVVRIRAAASYNVGYADLASGRKCVHASYPCARQKIKLANDRRGATSTCTVCDTVARRKSTKSPSAMPAINFEPFGIHYRIYRIYRIFWIYRIFRIRCQRLRLGPYLPHAPGQDDGS